MLLMIEGYRKETVYPHQSKKKFAGNIKKYQTCYLWLKKKLYEGNLSAWSDPAGPATLFAFLDLVIFMTNETEISASVLHICCDSLPVLFRLL